MSRACMHACTPTHMHTHPHTIWWCSVQSTLKNTHTHTRIHTHTHTHTTHIYTHTHTHPPSPPERCKLLQGPVSQYTVLVAVQWEYPTLTSSLGESWQNFVLLYHSIITIKSTDIMNFTVRHICKTHLRHYHITYALLYPQLYSPFRLSHTSPHHTCSSLPTAVFSFRTPLRHYHITHAPLYPQLYSPFEKKGSGERTSGLFSAETRCLHKWMQWQTLALFSTVWLLELISCTGVVAHEYLCSLLPSSLMCRFISCTGVVAHEYLCSLLLSSLMRHFISCRQATASSLLSWPPSGEQTQIKEVGQRLNTPQDQGFLSQDS